VGCSGKEKWGVNVKIEKITDKARLDELIWQYKLDWESQEESYCRFCGQLDYACECVDTERDDVEDELERRQRR
jgi:hypothetical protein